MASPCSAFHPRRHGQIRVARFLLFSRRHHRGAFVTRFSRRPNRRRFTFGKDAMKLTGAETLCESLTKLGVKDLFGYPGGAILPVYDALGKSKLHHVLVRHE